MNYDFLKEKIKIKSVDMESLSRYRHKLYTNPRLTYLFIELTDKCNLKCLHCGSSCEQAVGSYIDTKLLISTLETIAEDFTPSSVMVCLTGGEPLLHPDFFEIVSKIVELGFSWGMTTNGTLINDNMIEQMKNLRLQSITISLDGLEKMNDWFRGVPNSFNRAVNAIKHLTTACIPVQVTSVIHKKNYNELEALYNLMCELKVFSWRVINIEPIGRALQNQELGLSKQQFKALLEFIREKRYSKDTPIDVRFGCSHYLSYDYEREVRDNYFLCGSGIYVASILCNGDIFSCLDIERRKELIQGNIYKDRFSYVWFNKFKEFRRDRTQLCEQCSNCAEKEFCAGDSAHTWDYDNNKPIFCILN